MYDDSIERSEMRKKQHDFKGVHFECRMGIFTLYGKKSIFSTESRKCSFLDEYHETFSNYENLAWYWYRMFFDLAKLCEAYIATYVICNFSNSIL